MKKNERQKSRDTVPLRPAFLRVLYSPYPLFSLPTCLKASPFLVASSKSECVAHRFHCLNRGARQGGEGVEAKQEGREMGGILRLKEEGLLGPRIGAAHLFYMAKKGLHAAILWVMTVWEWGGAAYCKHVHSAQCRLHRS